MYIGMFSGYVGYIITFVSMWGVEVCMFLDLNLFQNTHNECLHSSLRLSAPQMK